MNISLNSIQKELSQCRLCEKHLPCKPNPLIQVAKQSQILIIGQAPSLKVEQSGKLWSDASGKRLLEWLNITEDDLYNKKKFSILPMGFCYPGKGENGDSPPRKECAPAWHGKIVPLLKPKLTLLIGSHAQNYYLRERRKKTLTETVRRWEEYLPEYIPLPHPSPLNNLWLHKNSWFIKEVIPEVRRFVTSLVNTTLGQAPV